MQQLSQDVKRSTQYSQDVKRSIHSTEVGLPEYEGAHVKQSAESKAKKSCSIGGRKSTRAYIVSSFAIGVLNLLLLLTTLIVTSVKIPEWIMNQFQCKSLTVQTRQDTWHLSTQNVYIQDTKTLKM